MTESWVRPTPHNTETRHDVWLALVLLLSALTTSQLYLRLGIVEASPPLWVWAAGLGLSVLPLAMRRRYPITVMWLVAIGFFIAGQFGLPEVLILNICMFIAVYTVGAWSQHRVAALWSRVGIIIVMISWLVVTLIIAASDTDFLPEFSRASIFSEFATFITVQIITNLLFFGGATYFGEKSWRSARVLAMLEAQGKELEMERKTSAVQAVALDRLMIARELHDVVAHHVSVMGLHAAAARKTLEVQPEKALASLNIVETSAADTITELRQLVHTLRTPNQERESQTVGLAQLGPLIDGARLAGTPTALIITGEQRPLPMLVDVACYRVIQEALTNVRKHAGTGAEATVRVRFHPSEIQVEVSDTGHAHTLNTPDPLGGLGIAGMRERIGAVGGTLTTGKRERGGFMVRATVPLDNPTQESLQS